MPSASRTTRAQPYAAAVTTQRSYLPYLAALAAAPALVLATQDNSLFTRPGMLDPWIYLGYFRDLFEFKHTLFPPLYYGSRLSWVLPGALVHTLLGAVAAAVVLHLGVHLLATFSLFFALDPVAGRRAAFLTALLFTVNPWLWDATGWDYVDGAGIALCLLSMALFTHAAVRQSRWLLAAAGAAAAATVYTNLFWAPLSLLLPLSYLGLVRDRHGAPPLRAALRAIPWMAAGAALLTALFALVNHHLDGHFNFYAPSIGFAIMKKGQNPFTEPFWTAHGLGAWLWFEVVAVLAALLLLPSRLRLASSNGFAAAVLSLQALAAIGFNSFMHWFGNGTLGLHYYASYMLPFTFSVIGISFWPALEQMGTRAFLAMGAAVAVVTALLWWDSAGRVFPSWPHLPALAVLPAAVCLAAALVWRARPAGVALALAGFLLLTAEVRRPYGPDPHANRRDYAALVDEFGRINAARRGHPVRFWLDAKGGFDPGYTALASMYLWEYTLLGRDFPNDGCRSLPAPDTLVVVTSRRPQLAEAARAAIAPCWSEFGFRAVVAGSDRVDLGQFPFTAVLLRAEPDAARWHALRLAGADASARGILAASPSADPLPLDRWVIWQHQGERASLHHVSGGLEVATPAGAYQYAINYPALVAPLTGRYRFTLHFAPGDGFFAFGAYAPATMQWRSVSSTVIGTGPVREMAFFIDLKAGETVELLIANNREGGGASRFVIDDMTAIVVTPAAP